MAITIVDDYLQLCQERRLHEAAAFLAEGAQLVFPGRIVFADLASMVEHGAGRYEGLRKKRSEFVTGTRHSDGATVVVSSGTLDGRTLDGSTFSGVRYVDMFVLEDGLILEQHVWNDLAEEGVIGPSARPDSDPLN